MNTRITPAGRADVALIFDLIRELAVYEKLEHAVTGNAEQLAKALFGERPCAEAFLLHENEAVIGYALICSTISTFLCQPVMYLEDIYVREAFRGRGHGKQVFHFLAQLAKQRDCGRMEWRVLDWNAPSIAFYQSLGATIMPEWHLVRMTAPEIARLAETL